ncbi:uncharacterized protein DMENIID0001_165240 [Sergentomyia squamirostris]
MYIFGGETQFGDFNRARPTTILLNDLCAFDLTTRTWEKCKSRGLQPPSMTGVTMVSHEDRLIVFGRYVTRALPFCSNEELYVYDLREMMWTCPKITFPWPSRMSGHTATVQGRVMVIFGGFHETECFLTGDIWCLDLDTLTWTKRESTGVEKTAMPRWKHYQFHLDHENLLIVGGENKEDTFNDMWHLNMKSPVWTWREIPMRQTFNNRTKLTICSRACKIGQKLIIIGKNHSPMGKTEELQSINVCDLSHVLDTSDPYAEWLTPHEIGTGIGMSPQDIKDIFHSSLVLGHGELIHFGGRINDPPLRPVHDKLHFIRPFF